MVDKGGDSKDGYDPAQFRVAASDSKGHNSRLWFRCQPGHTQQLEFVLQSRRFPYRTKGDILRHALTKHLAWLAELEPMRSVTSQVDAILEVLRDEEFSNEFQHLFSKIGERISVHLGQGSDGEARRLVLTVLNHLGSMPDGHWKDKYLGEVNTRYGHLLAKGPKAKIWEGNKAVEGD